MGYVIARENYGDDLIFLEKGKKYKVAFIRDLPVATPRGRMRKRKRFIFIKYGNQELPFPVSCFLTEREMNYQSNPLFGRF